MKVVKFLLLIFLFPIFASAGQVRNLHTSSQEMPSIHLLPGRSTVIRFSSPPKKVIIGNQNYFNIEFIDSDVTLQPLGNTSSNMFVYGDGFIYGFILKVNQSGDYDDLVFIRPKSLNFENRNTLQGKTQTTVPARKTLNFSIHPKTKSKIELSGEKFVWNDSIKSYYADVYVKALLKKNVSSEKIKIQILADNRDITSIKAVSESDVLNANIKTRFRIFANVAANQKLKLKLLINNEETLFDLNWKK